MSMDDELTEEHMANLPTVVMVKKKYRVGKHPPAEEAKEEEEEEEDEDDAGAILVLAVLAAAARCHY